MWASFVLILAVNFEPSLGVSSLNERLTVNEGKLTEDVVMVSLNP